MAKRIDFLKPGTEVELKFGTNPKTEPAVFLGITGTGEQRRATFRSEAGDGSRNFSTYEWDAYRFGNRWSFGTSAERLSLV